MASVGATEEARWGSSRGQVDGRAGMGAVGARRADFIFERARTGGSDGRSGGAHEAWTARAREGRRRSRSTRAHPEEDELVLRHRRHGRGRHRERAWAAPRRARASGTVGEREREDLKCPSRGAAPFGADFDRPRTPSRRDCGRRRALDGARRRPRERGRVPRPRYARTPRPRSSSRARVSRDRRFARRERSVRVVGEIPPPPQRAQRANHAQPSSWGKSRNTPKGRATRW